MNDKVRNLTNIILTAIIILGLSIACFFKPDTEFSINERRTLKKFPELKLETFPDEFEKYAQDQFPLRDSFMAMHSLFSIYGLGRQEIHDLYVSDGYISKIEWGLHEDSIAWSLNRFSYIQEKYLENSNVYVSIIPDKGYYLSEGGKYPYLDYVQLQDKIIEGTKSYATYIPLEDTLSKESYYRTDTHWKQTKLLPVTRRLLEKMGYEYPYSFQENHLSSDFYGVYYGQLSLPVSPDEINYFTGDFLDALSVTCLDTGSPVNIGVYQFEKATALDPYEFFLSGSKALIEIENPNAPQKKELVLFRDSFGSSIAMLLAGSYQKVTLVDIRYINPGMVGRFVNFEGADVLFLYSAQVLNNSIGQFIN